MRYAFFLSIFLLQVLPPRGVYPEAEGRRAQGQDDNTKLKFHVVVDINILLSVDPKSFPLGTGPKQHEIWHSGYYPIAWTNRKYKMIYTNMGHNDMDYEGKTNAQLSSTFSSPEENKFIINSLMWLGGVKK